MTAGRRLAFCKQMGLYLRVGRDVVFLILLLVVFRVCSAVSAPPWTLHWRLTAIAGFVKRTHSNSTQIKRKLPRWVIWYGTASNHDSCQTCHAHNKLKQIFLFIVFNYELSTKNSELKTVQSASFSASSSSISSRTGIPSIPIRGIGLYCRAISTAFR